MLYYFFLSYAHNNDNEDVAAFYDDLSVQLRVRTGADRDSRVGFRDNNILRAGEAWPVELIDAISTAKTFVALYSPRYFLSKVCGQEWSVFAHRLAEYEAQHGRRAPALIPLMWVDNTEVPARLKDIQHGDFSFGQEYARHGAWDLVQMRNTRHHDAYRGFVRAVAVRIKEIAATHHLPEYSGPRALADIPNAFDPTAPVIPVQTSRRATPQTPTGDRNGGTRPLLRYETDTP